MKTMNASEFKARCLALLDEVRSSGEGLVITKRGHPIAQLLPLVSDDDLLPQETLLGSVEILGDIIAPAVPAEDWESERR